MMRNKNEIRVYGSVNNSQILQGSNNSCQHQNNFTINYEQVQELTCKMKNEVDSYNLDILHKGELLHLIDSVNTLALKKEDSSKVKSGIIKIKEILINFGTGAASSGIIALIGRIIGV